ncbi:signal transducer and activator of transcription 1-alpha/beta isoform X4 [Lates calcarifer]|uniref:Signal transducer and activator of transcription n=1 Tax=Lates calcarifer TaxID=8187 RepID=A0AAJ7LNE3_LATCA|nr:signal transducer and activator of transcription 1-alpha/beta isoform X4 [Lates calcarifer]
MTMTNTDSYKMTQWEELLKRNLIQGRLSQLYERKFPRHIRHSLCLCIESQDWDLAALDENKARACFHALLMYLDEQWNHSLQENNFLPGPDFPGMKDYLVKHFQDEPLNLAVILSECLQEEKKVLASASEKQGCGSPAVQQKWKELDRGVNELKRQISEVKKEVKSLEFLYENLDYVQKTWQNKVEQDSGLAQSNAAVKEGCLKQANFIMQTKQMMLQQIVNILNQAEQIVAALTDVELPEWKRRQQLACIGGPVDTSLDHLEEWFTAVADVLIQVNQELQKLQDQSKKYNSPDASSFPGETENFTLSLLTKLLANALVVEKQPVMSSLPQRPLILKTGVRFTAAVRFLANLPEFKCRVKVKPVFDKDVEETTAVHGLRHFAFNRDNSKVLDVDRPDGGLVAEFAHMSLKESKTRPRGSCEQSRLGVTEELHVIKFVTELQFAGLSCNIEASSLPVVVISSTSQIPSAWASVMWCNMLSTSEPRNLSLFVDPPPLTWQQLSQVLSWQFLSVGQRGLDEDQLSMLRDKIVDNPDGIIHWDKFSKNESVWIWIDGILDLIKRHLVDLWQDGYIMGFVSRKTTWDLLKEKPTGTFLIRFSESSKEGAVTFSFVEHSNGENNVHAVEPYTKKDLLAQSLPDSIDSYRMKEDLTRNPLLYLYPDIHRDTAFGRYYSTEKAPITGYVTRRRVQVADYPTPPPSPPPVRMDIDPDVSAEQVIQELFHDIYDSCGSPVWLTSYQDTPLTQYF